MFCTKNIRLKGARLNPVRKAASLTLLAVLATFIFLPLSCSRSFSRGKKLPADPSMTSELGWALVTMAYARLKVAPDEASADAGSLRSGEIFACRQRRIDPAGSEAGGFWYQYTEGSVSGWVKEGDVEIFASEELAKASLPAAMPQGKQ